MSFRSENYEVLKIDAFEATENKEMKGVRCQKKVAYNKDGGLRENGRKYKDGIVKQEDERPKEKIGIEIKENRLLAMEKV